jgi:hypothetical protein
LTLLPDKITSSHDFASQLMYIDVLEPFLLVLSIVCLLVVVGVLHALAQLADVLEIIHCHLAHALNLSHFVSCLLLLNLPLNVLNLASQLPWSDVQ